MVYSDLKSDQHSCKRKFPEDFYPGVWNDHVVVLVWIDKTLSNHEDTVFVPKECKLTECPVNSPIEDSLSGLRIINYFEAMQILVYFLPFWLYFAGEVVQKGLPSHTLENVWQVCILVKGHQVNKHNNGWVLLLQSHYQLGQHPSLPR